VIASVAGVVAAAGPESVVVEVGGVGLAVQCTPATVAGLHEGQPVRLATSLVVREDSLTLYGFTTDDERHIFELLQAAAGVGPRLAQAVLAVHPPAAVRAAVAGEDIAALTQVPGVGRKGAQRIILDLKDRIGAVPPGGGASDQPGGGVPARPAEPAWREPLRSALRGLGWTAREVDEAVASVGPEAEAATAVGDQPDLAELLRAALRSLSRA
jgi:Holliday junction DNA helicase RuvA